MGTVLRPLALPLAVLAVGLTGLVATRAAATGTPRTHYRPLAQRAVIPAQTAAHPVTPAAPTPRPTPVPDPPATPAPPQTTVQTMLVGTVQRQWEQIGPGTGLAAGAPIIMVLHGQAVLASDEVGRDGLAPLVSQNRAELVYPQGIDKSWNAGGGCCGGAGQLGIDDLDFVRDLATEVDPGHAHPIYLLGYSNGGRLAYSVACNAPVLFDAYVVVAAMPQSGCGVTRPVSILQIAGTADPAIPYLPGQPGIESPPATVQVARLRATDACPAAPASEQQGRLTLQTWTGCAAGTRVGFATYAGGDHGWPIGDATTPAAAPVIWRFLSGRPW
jgi:polyhydroxybutyrate depolymerase